MPTRNRLPALCLVAALSLALPAASRAAGQDAALHQALGSREPLFKFSPAELEAAVKLCAARDPGHAGGYITIILRSGRNDADAIAPALVRSAIQGLGTDPQRGLIGAIVQAAVKAAPTEVLDIVTAAVKASPRPAAREIVTAAISAVPHPDRLVTINVQRRVQRVVREGKELAEKELAPEPEQKQLTLGRGNRPGGARRRFRTFRGSPHLRRRPGAGPDLRTQPAARPDHRSRSRRPRIAGRAARHKFRRSRPGEPVGMSAPAADPAAASAGRSLRARLLSWPALVLLVLLGLVAWGGARLYIQRRDRMLFAAAARALDARDFPAAWVWLQRLYRERPNNIDTIRLIARLEADERAPDELQWRVRAIRIGPAVLDDYLGWAAAALRLGQNAVAVEALEHVPAQWQGNAAYHEMLGGAFAAAGQLGAADANFAEAARLEPANPVHLVNLAALRLTSPSEEIRRDARASLERVASSAGSLPAIRALLEDATRQRDAARTARFRAAMRRQAGRTLEDELACISAAPSTAGARAELAALWKTIATDPPQALQVAEWMMRRGDSLEALDWLRKLPPAAQSAIPIQMGLADGLAALRDWRALRSYLAGRNWRNCDFLRAALLVRCARESGASAPAWADAIAACRGDASDMLLLAQTAAGWSWQAEGEALYWQIALLGYPAREPALKALWESYSATGNTGGLLRVAREQYGDAPADAVIRNNFAFLSLLTGIGGADVQRIAEEDYRNQPENANIAATYAYSLYVDGRYQEGLRVMKRFGENRLQAAGAALYLALLEQAAGETEAAGRSATAVDPARLLPEERLLLRKIAPKTSQAGPVPANARA